MISKTVTQTQRFLRLPLETQALYFHLIQNADDDGIVEAFPVVRMIGASEDSISLLVVKNFIIPLNDEMVYFVIDFHEQNTIRADRKVNSVYINLLKEVLPDIEVIEPKQRADRIKNSCENMGQPEDDPMADMGRHNISKGKVSKGKVSKDKLDKDNVSEGSSSSDFQSLSQIFESNFGRLMTPFELEDMEKLIKEDKFPPEVIEEAMREATLNKKPYWKYLLAILSRYKNDGLMTRELIQVEREQKAERKAKAQAKSDPAGNIPTWSVMHPDNQKTPEPKREMTLEEAMKIVDEAEFDD